MSKENTIFSQRVSSLDIESETGEDGSFFNDAPALESELESLVTERVGGESAATVDIALTGLKGCGLAE